MKMQVVNCPNCNGQVQVDASKEFGFCSFCGTKILLSNEAPANATQSFVSNREAAINEISKINDHMTPVLGNWNEIAGMNRIIQRLKNGLPHHGELAGGIICLFIGILFIINLITEDNINTAGKIVIPFLGTALIVLGLFLLFVMRKKNRNRDIDRISELEMKREELWRQIVDAYNSYPHCPIGIEYCSPQPLKEIYDCLRMGRAETIKEAINLLLSDKHNAEMLRVARNTQAVAQANLKVNTANMMNNILR